MSRYRTLDDVNVTGKRVLVRLDLNVPVEGGKITDLTRIERVLPTLRELLASAARVIVLSHFDRPKGKVVPEMSLAPLGDALESVIGKPVVFVPTDWQDTAGAVAAIGDAEDGALILMENTRFHPGEETNDADFAHRLADLGDIFVNDAFSAAHRAHASTEGIAHILPAVAGRAMAAELTALTKALDAPERPLVAVVGGAKISTKLELLGTLSTKVDSLIVGGGMANTFLAAQGKPMGKSLCEHDLLDAARDILAGSTDNGCEIILPGDVVVAEAFAANAPHRTVPVGDVAENDMILDLGVRSLARLDRIFEAAKTLVWNGPLGAFELTPFDAGTNAAAKTAARLCQQGKLLAVAGGGDTVAALNHAGVGQDFTYISTAGGAFLEWLEGKPLPGVLVLQLSQTPRSNGLNLEQAQ